MDELGIEALQIGENEELFDVGVMAHVAIELRIGIAPLPSGEAEEGIVREIGLGSAGDSDQAGVKLAANFAVLRRRSTSEIVSLECIQDSVYGSRLSSADG